MHRRERALVCLRVLWPISQGLEVDKGSVFGLSDFLKDRSDFEKVIRAATLVLFAILSPDF